MTSFMPVRRVWLCTVYAGLALLCGCGGTSTGPSITPPVPKNCSIQVNALKPPSPGGGSWNAFQNYILPNTAVQGVNIYVPWNTIETSQGVYDFSTLDGQIANYPGKKINLDWMAVNYGNINDSQGGVNNMTPSYVFTTSWAVLAGATSPQDVVYCSPYPGNGTFVNTSANILTPGFDSTGYPVVYEAPFRVAYQNFITAVLNHYQGNSAIGYMRFGLSVGNEADAYCTAQMQALPAPNTFAPNGDPSTWENWVKTMVSYEKSQLSTPPIQLMQSMNSLDTVDKTVLPDFEAATAVANGFGFGSNGLQKSDITASATNTTCTADWCAMFDKYTGQVPLELQTSTPSDPSGSDPTNPTGNLANLIPVAVQHNATILELALSDLYLAFDPNYAPQNPADAAFAGAYNTALSDPCAQ